MFLPEGLHDALLMNENFLDDGFGMNPLASRLSKIQHSVAIDRLDCST